jgi:NADH dehydrogenase
MEVRVLTRDPRRAAHLAAGHVEVVTGDVRDRISTTAAVAGAEVVISAVQGLAGPGDGSPATVDRDGNMHLIQAARAAGARVVLMSVAGAAPDSPFELFRMKHAAETYLAASGVPATVVRATAFLELWIDLLTGTAGRSGRPLVFGRGRNPVNFVSVRDVGALVERVATDQEPHDRTLEIGGPDTLTLTALARMVAASRGGSREPRHLPRPALHVMAATAGRLRPGLGRQARSALAMDRYDMTFRASPNARDTFTNLSCTSVAELLHAAGPAGEQLSAAA